jgi:hypothetical protein
MNADVCPRMPLEPPPGFLDPRREPHFIAAHWPLCNGEPAPGPETTDLHERRCIEFLAAFYRINVLNSRLVAARQAPAEASVIKSLLAEVEGAMAALENLEDRYAPIGFFGEPVMDGIAYRSISFVRPEMPAMLPKASTCSSHIAIPGLEEIPQSELQGPVHVNRWRNAKMDL